MDPERDAVPKDLVERSGLPQNATFKTRYTMKSSIGTFLIVVLLSCLGPATLRAQGDQQLKVVLITLDGLRWQELFSGADPLLIGNKEYVGNPDRLKERFWRDNPGERRKALMPFLWEEVSQMGQLHGNRTLGNKVDLTNTMWFSYPGYNEILTGKADDVHIRSNDKVYNPNTTFLERFNNSPGGRGSVAAFGSWDVFPYIINEKRSGIPVNAGFERAKGELTEREKFLNRLQGQIPSPWGSVRLDAFTHHYALEHMKKAHPRLVHIAYGETDDFAHDGDYQAYLEAAHKTDGLIRELWEFVQGDAFYRDRTVFVITTDHGRGTQPLSSWKGHGSEVRGAGEVWLVAFGYKVRPLGELREAGQLHSNQIAPTLMGLLGMSLPGDMPGRPIAF